VNTGKTIPQRTLQLMAETYNLRHYNPTASQSCSPKMSSPTQTVTKSAKCSLQASSTSQRWARSTTAITIRKSSNKRLNKERASWRTSLAYLRRRNLRDSGSDNRRKCRRFNRVNTDKRLNRILRLRVNRLCSKFRRRLRLWIRDRGSSVR